MIYKESTTSRANSAEQAEQSMQCTSSCSEQELTREEKRREEKRREEKRSKTLAIRGGAHLGTWASSSWARESLGEPPKRRGWELLSAGIPGGTTKTERLGALEWLPRQLRAPAMWVRRLRRLRAGGGAVSGGRRRNFWLADSSVSTAPRVFTWTIWVMENTCLKPKGPNASPIAQ